MYLIKQVNYCDYTCKCCVITECVGIGIDAKFHILPPPYKHVLKFEFSKSTSDTNGSQLRHTELGDSEFIGLLFLVF